MNNKIKKRRVSIFNLRYSLFATTMFYVMASLLLLSCAGTSAFTENNDTSNAANSAVKNASKNMPTPSPAIDEWTGTVGRQTIRITRSDIVIEEESRVEKLLSTFVTGVRREKIRRNPEIAKCRTNFSYNVTSLVGRFLSLEQETIEDCPDSVPFGNNAGRRTLPITIDLDRNGKVGFDYTNGFLFNENDRSAKLTDVITPSELIDAILNLPAVYDQKPEIVGNRITKLSELIVALKGVDLGSNGFGELSNESFRAFKFERFEGDFVFVRLSLLPAGTRRNAEYVEIKVQVPQSMRDDFINANNGSSGFLQNMAGVRIPFEIDL